ncbi:hypothetical protein ACH5RR_039548 [Cinchona calisaya]|uniref:Uncharacterized protein n=1 Tax=Cinchona calisaya TaxID=153742 RepID=A0ABD2Y3S4_9GENT
MFMPRTIPGGQPSIKSVLQGKEAKEKVDLAVTKWMIDASIPFNAANSAYYQTMFDVACSFGAGYKTPNFYDLHGLVDSDDRPSMGYLYAGMHKAREEHLRRFHKRKKRVDHYLRILDSRWDSQLHKNLQAAGFWLNLAYQYNSLDMSKHKHTKSGLLDVIERYSYGNPVLMSNLTREMKLFRKAEGDFGRMSDRDVMLPELHFYTLYLMLSRNARGRNYDPIDFEEFCTNDTWVLEDEPPNLTEAEMETFRKELAACTI